MSCPYFISIPLWGNGDNLNAKQAILQKIKDGTFALLSGEQIAKKLRLSKKEKAGLYAMLDDLYREGELLRDSSFRYGTKQQFCALEGTISLNERGFGFFIPDDKKHSDLFIPHRALSGAMHTDRVLAVRTGGRMGDEGEILAVLERGIKETVGVFKGTGRFGSLTPDDKRFSEAVFIPAGKTKGCKSGMKAVARITDYGGRGLSGEII